MKTASMHHDSAHPLKPSRMDAGAWLFALILFGLCGCKSGQNIQASAPEWTQNLPMDPGYYVGIASAPESSYPGRALEVAKERALGDLARTISVKVESSSALNTLQQDDRIRSSFREQSQSTSNADLEGYELMGTWESDASSWAYYRLSRVKWAQIVAARKAAAIEIAIGFYESALQAVQEGDVLTGIDRYLRGMEALRAYWGELNEGGTSSGERIVVDRACLDGITEILASLRIEPSKNSLELSFANRFQEELTVQIFSHHLAVANLPISYRYHRGTLPRTGTLTTNPDGLVAIPVQGFEPQLSHSSIEIRLRLAETLSEGHLEGAAMMLEGLSLPALDIPISLMKPVVCIQSREFIYNQPMNGNRLGITDALAEALHQQGFQVTESCRDAGLVLEIESDTERHGSAAAGGFHTAYLNARVRVIHGESGNLILQKNLDRVKGVQLDWDAAAIAAYDKAAREIKGRFVTDLVESLYR